MYFNNHNNTKYILNDIPGYITIEKNIYQEIQNKKLTQSSKYTGVTFSKQIQKYKSIIVNNKKQIHLGSFVNQIDAAKAYNKKAQEFNNCGGRYKINELLEN